MSAPPSVITGDDVEGEWILGEVFGVHGVSSGKWTDRHEVP